MQPVEEELEFDLAPPPRAEAWLALFGSVAIADHREGQCRWPVGDPARYCGAPAKGNYCEHHHKLGTRPTPPPVEPRRPSRKR